MTVVDKAAQVLLRGGVIAYPTESVFGLGCLPGDVEAVDRLLQIKQRDPAKGLILIAANATQFDAWIDLPESTLLPDPVPDKPITWIVPARDSVKRIVRGDHEGIAVRITTNTVAKSICEAVASPIVSTSANLSGQVVAADQADLKRQFGSLVDYIVPGDCDPGQEASEIRSLESGAVLRAGKDN